LPRVAAFPRSDEESRSNGTETTCTGPEVPWRGGARSESGRCSFGHDAEPGPRRGRPVPVLHLAEHVAEGHEAHRAAVAGAVPVVAQHETHPVRHLRPG